MKKIKFLSLSFSLLLVSALQAQTVDEIIAKHVDAIGGKEKLAQLKSLYIETSVEVMGNQIPAVETLLEGKGFKSETEFNGSKIIQCFTDKGGWSVNPMGGAVEPQAMPDELYKAGKGQINFGGSLVDYAAKGNKVELLGKEGNNYKLKVATGSSIESVYFIDTTTYLISKITSKAEMMGQSVDVVMSFSDYKKTDFGITVPYTRDSDFGSFALSSKVSKLEVNKEIDPKIFEMSK
jgi:hypothetical protein